eukprot:CAMPEP_0185915244 /NCGR_PEP_ID=MMETSP0924C-20121207/2168_1 /TAXON_ID=321610 /ORGANISM="Perkinsus chesapeaki, Strain ATCC PRA-65" /LENGTH=45 /DNA_ID= /DNA_START= /DNA_END= /DNA_ORIENTATION=
MTVQQEDPPLLKFGLWIERRMNWASRLPLLQVLAVQLDYKRSNIT